MKIAASSVLKQTLLYGASIALMKGVSLLMLPFIANHLPTAAFGQLEVISSLAVVGSILVGMGLEDALFRFAGACKDLKQRRRIAAELFTLSVILGTVALLAGYLLADLISTKMPGDVGSYEVRLILATLTLEGCIAIPLGWLRMRNQAFSFFILTTGRAITQAILVILFLSAERGVAGVLEAGLIAAVAQSIVLAYLHLRDCGWLTVGRGSYPALIYSLPIVGSGLVAFALNGLDRWILADYASLTDVAHFGVAAKFALAVVLLLQPFGMWWSPRRFEVLRQPGGQQQVVNMVVVGIVLTLLIAVSVGLASPLLIQWMLPPEYALAGQYAIALVLVMAFKEIAELINLGCFTGKTTHTQLFINSIAASIGIIGMFLWAPQYGVWGVIAALLAAQTLRLVLFFTASQYFLPLAYPTRTLLLLTCFSVTCLGVGLQFSNALHQLWIALTASACLVTLVFMLKLLPSVNKVLSR